MKTHPPRPTRALNILVAGGAGFIGSNLCSNLLASGHNVECLDNFITGRQEAVASLTTNPAFSLAIGDVSETQTYSKLSLQTYDMVFDLACPTGVPNIRTLGEEMMIASSAGTLNLLKIARDCDAKFFFASSAEIYGDAEVAPQTESYAGSVDPTGPRSPYEEGKRFGEAITKFFYDKYEVRTYIARFFNTYGPGMSVADTRVVPQFLARAINRDEIIVYGDGSQTRCFLYIDDLIAAVRLIMDKGQPGEVYNIGSAEATTIKELLHIVEAAVGEKCRYKLHPHFIDDHNSRLPDTLKLQTLGWRQTVSLRRGLEMSYASMALQVGKGLRKPPQRSVKVDKPVGSINPVSRPTRPVSTRGKASRGLVKVVA